MKSKILLFLLFTGNLWFNVFAQPAVLDPQFGNQGVATFQNYQPYGYIHNIAVQSTKKILVSATLANDYYGIYGTIRRLNTDGSLDSSFSTGGMIRRFGFLNSMVLQSDDKIVVMNTSQPHYEYPIDTIYIYRYSADGKADSAFGTNGRFAYGKVWSDISGSGLIKLTDGSFVALGKQNAGSAFIKLSTDGIQSASFGNTNGRLLTKNAYDGTVSNFVPTPDNKFLVATTYTRPNGATGSAIVTYNSLGKRDATGANKGLLINDNVIRKNTSIGLIFQSDNKLIEFTEDKGNDVLLRFNADGTPDLTYGTNGKVIVAPAGTIIGRNVQLQTGDKLLISPTNSTILKRYLPSGAEDASFGLLNMAALSQGNTYTTKGDSIITAGFHDIDEYETDLIVASYKPCSACGAKQKDVLLTTFKAVPAVENVGLKIYPNPVTNWINIVGLNTGTATTITITNGSGKVMQIAKTQAATYQLNVAKYIPGTYNVTIVKGNGTAVSYKIIKLNH